MPKIQYITTNFTAGALSPKVRGRVDLERYNNGAKVLHNCYPVLQGGVKRRPGTRYVSSVAPGVAYPVGEEYTCVSPTLLCNFSTNGAIDGTSPETAPDAFTTYDSASAVATDGWVSPANFDILIEGDSVRTYDSLVQAYVASGETVKVAFKTTSITDDSGTIVSVELAVGAGDVCTLAYQVYDAGSLLTEITDTFSIGASSATVLVTLEIVEAIGINLYLDTDFVTPAASVAIVDAAAYFDWSSIRVTSTGSDSAIDYIRCCGAGGTVEG